MQNEQEIKFKSVNFPINLMAYKRAKRLAVIDHRTPGKLMGMLLEKALAEYEKIILNTDVNDRTN